MSSGSLSAASLLPLLTSNDAPNTPHSVFVEEILREKQVELSLLEDEINRLKSALKVVQRNHSNLKAEMKGYKGILSPLRRLPAEILGEIFLYFVPSVDKTCPRYEPLSVRSQFAKVSPPWQLGQICRRWRAVALSLSELWAFLDLGPFYRYDGYSSSQPVAMDLDDDDFALELDDARGFGDLALGRPRMPRASELADAENADAEGFLIQAALEYLEGRFQRCGSRPFSLRLVNRGLTPKFLLDYIIARTALCRELVLPNPAHEFLDSIFHPDVSLPSLRKIVLTTQGGYLYITGIFVHPVAANLTDLTLVSVMIETSAADSIPWSRLTRYCEVLCRWVDSEQGRLAAYRKLTSLIDLRMDLADHTFFQAATVPVVLPNLRSVSLRIHAIYGTIQTLAMPMLEEFNIEFSHTRHLVDPYTGNAIQPVLCLFPRCSSHSRSNLRVFRAMSGSFSPPFDCASALEQFPNLVELSLNVPYMVTNTLISRLVPHDGNLPLAPKLERIHFPNRSLLHNDCLWQNVLDMLYARFRPTVPGVSRLHTFEFPTDSRGYDVDVVAGLKTLRQRNHWDIRVGSDCVFPAWDEWRMS
ncbi:hypothetical protein R3P38DRAFT_1345416 [Favolaschia claudopus]|uniref:F-box domain-containing protein n=1 Tax=Favolaschia claudopus TaxID=2862362 RepID=A0AAW0DSY9_9AGAR